MTIKIKTYMSALLSKLFKKEKTKEQYMQDIESLIKKAEVDYAKKRIKTNSAIHEYEMVKTELLQSKDTLVKQVVSLEKIIMDSDPSLDKIKNMENGAKILSLRNIMDNIDNRIGQIERFVSVAKESLSEQYMKHIEVCTTLRMKKSDLISFDIINRKEVDGSIFNDIKSISKEIESDIDEMEIAVEAEKIFSDSMSGKVGVESVYANERIEGILSEIIEKKKAGGV